MTDLNARIRAVCDLSVAPAREEAGRHEYDGLVQDLSPSGVAQGLARLAAARDAVSPLADSHDEAHLRAFEDRQHVVFRDLELHRRSPMHLLDELDLSVYDKEYAPFTQRTAARARHLDQWPAAVDAGLASLDLLSAPVAQSMLAGVRGLATGPGAVPAPPPAARTARIPCRRRTSQARQAGT